MRTEACSNTDVGWVIKDTVSYGKQIHTTNPISHPDGDRVAADVVGRPGTLLAQVTCSQQLAQVRHSWELEPQGKCSRWLRGWHCGRQAGRLAHSHLYTHTLREMDESWRKETWILSQTYKNAVCIEGCAKNLKTDLLSWKSELFAPPLIWLFSSYECMCCFGLSPLCGSVLAFSLPGG